MQIALIYIVPMLCVSTGILGTKLALFLKRGFLEEFLAQWHYYYREPLCAVPLYHFAILATIGEQTADRPPLVLYTPGSIFYGRMFSHCHWDCVWISDFMRIVWNPKSQCNPVAIARRTGEPTSLVLYMVPRTSSYCDRIALRFWIAL